MHLYKCSYKNCSSISIILEIFTDNLTSDRHYAKASTQKPGAVIPMGGISGISGISLASGSQSGASVPASSRAFLLGAIPHISSLDSFKGTGGLRVSYFSIITPYNLDIRPTSIISPPAQSYIDKVLGR